MIQPAGSPTAALWEYLEQHNLQLNTRDLREALQIVAQTLMDIEVSAIVDAGHYERRDSRRNYRNGYRDHTWKAGVGDVTLRIPKLRKGTYYPEFLDRPAQTEYRLLEWVRDAFVQGVDVVAVRALIGRMGLPAVHRSLMADAAERLDDHFRDLRGRPFAAHYRQLVLDVVSLGGVHDFAVAVGIRTTGERELLTVERVRDLDGIGYWRGFLGRLIRRGLEGVEVVVSDDLGGIRWAVREAFVDATWRYCRAYSLRDLLTHVPRTDQPEVIEAIAETEVHTDTPFVRGRSRNPTAIIDFTAAAELLRELLPAAA